jgi:hypothetical protein
MTTSEKHAGWTPKASNRRRGGAQMQEMRSGDPLARRASRFGAKQ